MSTLDYSPVLDGDPYDPAPAGGTVDNLQLFATADRTGVPHSTGLPALIGPGVYRFTINDSIVPAGRYWARVLWTPAAAGPQQADDLPGQLDLPVRTDLVVSPDELAARLGLPTPLDTATRTLLADAVLDAQTDVQAYLGRPIVPRITTERRAWPVHRRHLICRPVLEVFSETEVLGDDGLPTGYWDITYRGGLDARTDAGLRPIRRLVLALAAQQDDAVRLWATTGHGASGSVPGMGAVRTRALATEGQSVSYDYARPGDGGVPAGTGGSIGGPLRWASIDDWRLRGRRAVSSAGPGGLISVTTAY